MFGDRILFRIEAVKVAEREPRRIAQLAIAVSDALQNFVGAAHVVHVI